MPSSPRRLGVPVRLALLTSASLLAIVPLASAQDPTPTTTTPSATAPLIKAGVKVGDLDLSGRTRAEAVQLLTQAYRGKRASNADVVVRVANRPHRLTMERIGYGYDADTTAGRALKARGGETVQPAIGWDSAAFSKWLDALSSMQKRTRDATVRIGITKQRIRGSRKGWKLSRGALRKLVVPVLLDPAKDRSALLLPVIRTSPSVTIASLKRRYGTLITVDRQTFHLRLFKKLRLSKTYRIAVGAAGHDTPPGMYSITSKQVNPAWHVPNSPWAGSLQGQVIPGGAPNNPLKARWLGLRDGIGIHGTAESWSIGSRASHGCIRMHPSDVIDLYGRVPMGTAVKIR